MARAEGARFGAGHSSRSRSQLRRLADALAAGGYEPRVVDGTLELRNCPFHRVAQEQTALVCGLNLEYVGGVCEGLDCQGVETALEPAPGRCCVTARAATGTDSPDRSAASAVWAGAEVARFSRPAGTWRAGVARLADAVAVGIWAGVARPRFRGWSYFFA